MNVGELSARLGLDDSDFTGKMKAAEKTTESAGKKMMKSFTDIGKKAALGMAAAGAAVTAAMVKYGNFADELLDLSEITGMTTDEMQRWRRVAKRAGVDTDITTNAMQSLNRQLERGNEVSPRLQKAFETMNMDIQDFKNLEGDEQMRAIVQQMVELEGADRRAFANQMNMADMLPLIKQVEEDGGDLAQVLDSIDVPFDEDDLGKMNAFRQTWDEFKMTIFEVTGQALLPLFDWFNQNLPQIQEKSEKAFQLVSMAVTGLGEVFTDYIFPIFGQLGEWITKIVEWGHEWYNENKDTVEGIREDIESAFSTIREIIDGFVEFAIMIWDNWGEDFMKIASTAMSTIWGVINTSLNIIRGILDFFIGLFTGDWSRMRDGFVSIFRGLWTTIRTIISGAWNIVKWAFSALGRNISGWFTGLVSDGFKWGRNMIQGFIDGIRNMGSKVANAAKDTVKKAADFLKFWSPAKKGEGRYITDWGENMIDGFLDGVRNMTPELEKTVGDVIPSANMSTSVTGRSEIYHAGEITINGVNDRGQFIDSVKVLAESLKDPRGLKVLNQANARMGAR